MMLRKNTGCYGKKFKKLAINLSIILLSTNIVSVTASSKIVDGLVKNFCSINQTKWLKNSCYSLTQDNFDLLLDNKVPAIVVKNFLSKPECEKLQHFIKNSQFHFYENVFPPIGKIGITQFEHSSKDKSLYFKQVDEAVKTQNKIFYDSGVNVMEKVITTLSKNIKEYSTEIAYESGEGYYFSGLIRQIAAADLHFDYAPYDAPSWCIGQIINQIACNVYVDVPDEGGECVVYNKRWEPIKYEKFLSDNNVGSYGFKKELVDGLDFLKIKPSVGDLLFFNSRNFHEVLDSKQIRISVSSFVGSTNDKKLLFWS